MSTKIINNVTEEGYIQWIENFVREVISKANLKCQEVVIEDIEWSKRIFLKIDGEDYTIRTWNFHVVEYDENNVPCAEIVDYTLYKMVYEYDENGEISSGHGEEIDEDRIVIVWDNNLLKD